MRIGCKKEWLRRIGAIHERGVTSTLQIQYSHVAHDCQGYLRAHSALGSHFELSIRFLRTKGEWTRRDSNPHPRLSQSAVLPLHHGPMAPMAALFQVKRNVRWEKLWVIFPQWNYREEPNASTLFLCGVGSVSHAVRNTSLGARPRIFIK